MRPEELLELEPFSLGGTEKDRVLGAILHELTDAFAQFERPGCRNQAAPGPDQ